MGDGDPNCNSGCTHDNDWGQRHLPVGLNWTVSKVTEC